MSERQQDVLIIGAGIGGLSLALMLERAGIPCRVFEQAPEIRALGVGINLLPHATREFARLDLETRLAEVAVATADATFFNRFGQLIWREALGRAAGYDWPQLSIHRGELQRILFEAASQRIGSSRLHLGWRLRAVKDEGAFATARFEAPDGSSGTVSGAAVIGCGGIHSTIRSQLYPDEGEPLYSGINMWRGVARAKPFLSGASMVRAGWFATGKMVIYPIRNFSDGSGEQLVNWVAEVQTPAHKRRRDWIRPGRLEDFISHFAEWHFDWLDVPALIRSTETILEYPMVDQEPLPRWSFGRISLLGDAAHPMVPRGSNGAGQAIVDARTLTDALASHRSDPVTALKIYEDQRLGPTAKVVRTNRTRPPDAILGLVYDRTNDRPFRRIEDVVTAAELSALTDGYKQVAGYDKASLAARARSG